MTATATPSQTSSRLQNCKHCDTKIRRESVSGQWIHTATGLNRCPEPQPMDTVIAEDAPIGVQLWPTTTPESAPNFTLMEVRIVRREGRGYVTWIYENGNERHFDLGERVAVKIELPKR